MFTIRKSSSRQKEKTEKKRFYALQSYPDETIGDFDPSVVVFFKVSAFGSKV